MSTPHVATFGTNDEVLKRRKAVRVDELGRLTCAGLVVSAPLLRGVHAWTASIHGGCYNINDHHFKMLTRFSKIATQGTPQTAADTEAISLSGVYSKCNLPLF